MARKTSKVAVGPKEADVGRLLYDSLDLCKNEILQSFTVFLSEQGVDLNSDSKARLKVLTDKACSTVKNNTLTQVTRFYN